MHKPKKLVDFTVMLLSAFVRNDSQTLTEALLTDLSSLKYIWIIILINWQFIHISRFLKPLGVVGFYENTPCNYFCSTNATLSEAFHRHLSILGFYCTLHFSLSLSLHLCCFFDNKILFTVAVLSLLTANMVAAAVA